MRILKIVAAAWVLLVATTATLALLQGTPAGTSAEESARSAVASDAVTSEMLDGDLRMLEQMRSWVSPLMSGTMTNAPMWLDPAMVRTHEEYQARIDRMMARR